MGLLDGLTKIVTNAVVTPVNAVLDVTMINPLIAVVQDKEEFTDWFKSLGNISKIVEGLSDITDDKNSIQTLVKRAERGDIDAIIKLKKLIG